MKKLKQVLSELLAMRIETPVDFVIALQREGFVITPQSEQYSSSPFEGAIHRRDAAIARATRDASARLAEGRGGTPTELSEAIGRLSVVDIIRSVKS